jgi:hypothetical protein
MKDWFNLLCVWYQRISDPMRSFFCLQWQSQDLGQGCKLLNYFSVIFSKQNHGTTYTKLWKNIHHSNYTNSSTSHYLTPQHTPSKHQSLTIHNQHLNIGKIKHDSCHVSMASVTYLHLLHPIQLFHIVTNLLKGKTLEWQLFKITN